MWDTVSQVVGGEEKRLRRRPQDFLNGAGFWERNTFRMSFPSSLNHLPFLVGPSGPSLWEETEENEKKTTIVRIRTRVGVLAGGSGPVFALPPFQVDQEDMRPDCWPYT